LPIGRSRGFCFITFSSPSEAQIAIERMNGAEVDGRNLKVNLCNERPPQGRGQDNNHDSFIDSSFKDHRPGFADGNANESYHRGPKSGGGYGEDRDYRHRTVERDDGNRAPRNNHDTRSGYGSHQASYSGGGYSNRRDQDNRSSGYGDTSVSSGYQNNKPNDGHQRDQRHQSRSGYDDTNSSGDYRNNDNRGARSFNSRSKYSEFNTSSSNGYQSKSYSDNQNHSRSEYDNSPGGYGSKPSGSNEYARQDNKLSSDYYPKFTSKSEDPGCDYSQSNPDDPDNWFTTNVKKSSELASSEPSQLNVEPNNWN